MGNKLKNVFSNEEISFGGKINFKDSESYKQFLTELEVVKEEGKTVQVKGIESVETLVRNGRTEYPIEEKKNICEFIISPSMDEVSFEVDTDYGKKKFILKRYWINKGTALQTSENAIVFLKIFFERDTMTSKINYKVQPEKAENVRELIESYSIILSFFNMLFKNEIEESEEAITIGNMKRYFENSIEEYKKLEFIEKELGVAFIPEDLLQNEENWTNLEEVYLILKEKKVIRLNGKIEDTEVTGMKVSQKAENIKCGDELDITFITSMDYSFWNINITLFAACLFCNAIVKEIYKAADDEIKILYGSEDSRPMYISYMGFKTEEEAKEEAKNIISHKDKYINALTVTEYINKKIMKSK